MTIKHFDLAAAPRIGIEEAKEKFDQDAGTIFLDVRSKESYDKAHIPGAISMPFKEFPKRIRELPYNREIIPY